VKTTDETETTGAGLRLAILAAVVIALGLNFGLAVILIIAALIVMIYLHELGHYIMAKAAGMKVTEFFLGFGPRIWSFRRGETEYGVKAIPAGAYVKIIGMSNLDEVDPADEDRTYRAKPYWRRLSVAVAGSTMHFLLAFALALVVFVGFGTADPDSDDWSLRRVTGPAKAAGLRTGDRIDTVDGRHFANFDRLSEHIRSKPGGEVDVVVDRDGDTRSFTVTLAAENPDGEKVGYLGIAPGFDMQHAGLIDGAGRSVTEFGRIAKGSVVGLGRLFSPDGIDGYVDHLTGDEKTKAGPAQYEDRPTSVVGIVQVGDQLAKNGLAEVFYLLFAVNVFIGLFNLTPLLPFDGGHVAVATYEKIRSMISGRRYYADFAKLMPVAYAVVLVLALLFVTTIYLDIVNPVDIG
jgi:membrane-associated protease RseP (regulator of RpoE activity)